FGGGVEGLFLRSAEGPVIRLDTGNFLQELTQAQAIVLQASPDELGLSLENQKYIHNALQEKPFFAVVAPDASQEYIDLLREQTTIFDKLLVSEELSCFSALLQHIVPEMNRQDLADYIQRDLTNDIQAQGPNIQEYCSSDYWESRAQSPGIPGLNVCYASSPRWINKAMHNTQVSALDSVLKNAVEELQISTLRPTLLEYGCGVGRLARFCTKYTTYHGTDISPSMIAKAQQLVPDTPFCTTEQLEQSPFPKMDIFMTCTVLHHNREEEQLKILRNCAQMAKSRVRLILLEDFIGPQKKSNNMFPLNISRIQSLVSRSFGGMCTLSSFRLLGYKPNTFLQRTALLELKIER
ncbi:MAG: class I SAM-dependent methyltransferase, partial [Candidatus Electrothrix sp. AUS4]|nr:class I SAM-dependent methyltransferase [Candidatus Electrothrix sp. AUS4]